MQRRQRKLIFMSRVATKLSFIKLEVFRVHLRDYRLSYIFNFLLLMLTGVYIENLKVDLFSCKLLQRSLHLRDSRLSYIFNFLLLMLSDVYIENLKEDHFTCKLLQKGKYLLSASIK